MSENDDSMTSVTFDSQRGHHPVEAVSLSHKIYVAFEAALGAQPPGALLAGILYRQEHCLLLPSLSTGFQLLSTVLHIYKS